MEVNKLEVVKPRKYISISNKIYLDIWQIYFPNAYYLRRTKLQRTIWFRQILFQRVCAEGTYISMQNLGKLNNSMLAKYMTKKRTNASWPYLHVYTHGVQICWFGRLKLLQLLFTLCAKCCNYPIFFDI